MKASVIIPTYKRSDFLLDCLDTIRRQDFPDDEYEILIVDNAEKSLIELESICDPFGKPSVIYIHEPHNGLHNARHAGARHARGDILVYIDDDVRCPDQWLAQMVAPYQESNVDMVAGRVFLKYEVEPPDWLFEFSSFLSAFDLGATPHQIKPFGSWVGCNMSLRKSVLYELGGFNPDGFGDRNLIHFRGDGECGLTIKAHERGLRLWYAPEAWHEHRIPASRMTQEYLEWHGTLWGIEDAYGDLRYNRRSLPGLLLRTGMSALYFLYHRLQSYRRRGNDAMRLRHLAAAKRYESGSIQRLRLVLSSKLRAHTFKSDYLNPES